MNLVKAVNDIGTTTELKRIACAYVIDYRNLSEEEIRKALIKTGPQYYFPENIANTLVELALHSDRYHRVLTNLLLKKVLLHKDGFMCPKKETEDDIIAMEQAIVNESNEDLLTKNAEKDGSLKLFQFVLETAWQHEDSISPDEQNLIDKIKARLSVTDTEHSVIEAKLGKFPKPGNEPHTRTDIENTRRLLQAKGLLFSVRDKDNTDYDIIPEEIAMVLRSIWNIEIRRHGYSELLTCKYVRSKKYLSTALSKSETHFAPNLSLQELQEVVLEQTPPSILLGGTSPRDGLDVSDLKKWCTDLHLNVSGSKADLIQRVIEHYDNILERDECVEDERVHWYTHFEKFAARDLSFLRGQQLIEKDLECERKFEEATKFLFEKKLFHQPLKQAGTAHADGALSYQDKVIFWDNKSKESPVNLADHTKQFDGYVKASEKDVAGFMVIAPEFTPDSALEAMKYQVESGKPISLITADELKHIAELWHTKMDDKQEDPFPLGYLIQPGRANKDMIATLIN